MPAGSCKQRTAELAHLIVGAYFTRTHTDEHTARNRVQNPTDKNTCINMTHIETEMTIFMEVFYSIFN